MFGSRGGREMTEKEQIARLYEENIVKVGLIDVKLNRRVYSQ